MSLGSTLAHTATSDWTAVKRLRAKGEVCDATVLARVLRAGARRCAARRGGTVPQTGLRVESAQHRERVREETEVLGQGFSRGHRAAVHVAVPRRRKNVELWDLLAPRELLRDADGGSERQMVDAQTFGEVFDALPRRGGKPPQDRAQLLFEETEREAMNAPESCRLTRGEVVGGATVFPTRRLTVPDG